MTGVRRERTAVADAGARIWDRVCRHCDGIAIGSTMAALASRGALSPITARRRHGIGDLERSIAARPGYLRVAIRLLADQGWVRISGRPGTDDLTVIPTPSGATALTQFGTAYCLAPALLAVAAEMDSILSGTADADGLRQAVRAMSDRWSLPGTGQGAGVASVVAVHLDGHIVAPVMTTLTRNGVLRPGTAVYRLDDIFALGGRQALALAVETLRLQGWAVREGAEVRLTPAGQAAVDCAPQYWHPVCYLPLLRHVPALLFGDRRAQPITSQGAAEEHQNRELDIRFSGQVFARTCQAPFLDVVLPVFDRPAGQQPSAVVDVGCGDGTLLTALHEAIRTRTLRGTLLGSHPLRFAGAEPSAVARAVAARRMDEAGVPGTVVAGDIADPDGLGRALADAGISPHDALYVCKSVIHDRPYRDPGDVPLPGAPPGLLSTFADQSGASIPGEKISASLVVLFRAWRKLAARHGFVVIEAHATDPVLCAAQAGRLMATSLDATHGYSGQYLVTPDVFSWAARAGGFTSRAHREPGAGSGGYTPLTIDHLIVTEDT